MSRPTDAKGSTRGATTPRPTPGVARNARPVPLTMSTMKTVYQSFLAPTLLFMPSWRKNLAILLRNILSPPAVLPKATDWGMWLKG